jgi:hypothetical protein
MADFKSDRVTLKGSAQQVFDNLCAPEKLRDLLTEKLNTYSSMSGQELPDNVKEALKSLEINSDGITIKGGPTGEVRLRKGDSKPYSLVKYDGVNTPVPLGIEFRLEDEGAQASAQVVITAEVPVFIRPMIAGPMDKAAKMFASMLEKIPTWG